MPVPGQQEQITFRPRPCHDPKTGVKSPRVSPLPWQFAMARLPAESPALSFAGSARDRLPAVP
jgi:hypothetical protein